MTNNKQHIFSGFLIVSILISNSFCLAQRDTNITLLQLPSLSILIDSAYSHSPLLNAQSKVVKQGEILSKIQRRDWLKTIAINSNYSRGTNNAQIEGVYTPTFSSTVTNFYGTGVSFNLPISILANRKQEISITKLNQSIANDDLVELKKQIKLIVVDLYLDIKLKEKVMRLRNDAVSLMSINFNYSQMAYENNSISLSEFSTIHELNLKIKIEYEVSKKNYLLAISMLEENVGFKLR